MKTKKVLALAAAVACVSSMAFATPQTQFEKGQWQLDLGAWNPKAEVDGDNFSNVTGDVNSDSKWNFQGGLNVSVK